MNSGLQGGAFFCVAFSFVVPIPQFSIHCAQYFLEIIVCFD
ncbi:hypothetical protein SUBVAR_06371 [Subdoligranulum variabile DSM 15176]|uniref:Uncharacterized protein n=1 Tax=Subdoligranulum variabile DSM 15176 TaxID=411471 RepID=D1PPQ4_9FIRM|nr:hypothetical protein SUBVAR_06371 [Subdoligranulum variabile DSM 15176]